VKTITMNGETLTVKEWSDRTGLGISCIYRRMEQSPFPEVVLNTPRRHGLKPKEYEANGESMTIRGWAEKTGLSPQCINSRLKIGWTMEKAISTPVRQDGDWDAETPEREVAGLKFSYSL
jgi:predicted DNA-binding transcriptional regulator AlpA